MSKHVCKNTKKLMRKLVKQGCKIKGKGQQFMVFAPDKISMVTIHMSKSGRSLYPLQRFAKNLGYDVS